jgi:hypothetical protein
MIATIVQPFVDRIYDPHDVSTGSLTFSLFKDNAHQMSIQQCILC